MAICHERNMLLVTEFNMKQPIRPPDEGISKFSYHLSREMNSMSGVNHVINIKPPIHYNSIIDTLSKLPSRLLLSRVTTRKIVTTRPELVMLLSNPVGTLDFIKSIVLRMHGIRKTVLLHLQPPKDQIFSKIQNLKFLNPELVWVQSPKMKEQWENNNVKALFLPSGVDLDEFKPLTSVRQKHKLREKFGLSHDKLVILHVGHLRLGRNVKLLNQVANFDNTQVFLVTSKSQSHSKTILKELDHRIVVVNEYLPQISEVYQASDIYIFPVNDEGSAIGFPLSILEALACNIPVISTYFGALPYFFPQSNCVNYFKNTIEIFEIIKMIKKCIYLSPRKCVESFSWSDVARTIINKTSEALYDE